MLMSWITVSTSVVPVHSDVPRVCHCILDALKLSMSPKQTLCVPLAALCLEMSLNSSFCAPIPKSKYGKNIIFTTECLLLIALLVFRQNIEKMIDFLCNLQSLQTCVVNYVTDICVLFSSPGTNILREVLSYPRRRRRRRRRQFQVKVFVY